MHVVIDPILESYAVELLDLLRHIGKMLLIQARVHPDPERVVHDLVGHIQCACDSIRAALHVRLSGQIAAEEKPQLAASASKPAKPRSVAAKASIGTKYAARKLEAQGKVKVASLSKRRFAVRGRMGHSSNGVRVAAQQVADFSHRRSRTVVAESHPYAILGTTPGFMKPERSRKMG